MSQKIGKSALRRLRESTTIPLAMRIPKFPLRRINTHLLPDQPLFTPSMIQLEPTNKCNLKCQMCHRSILFPSKIGEMSFFNFRKIVDPLIPSLESVRLQGEGEPFLCKDIFKMIRYLKTKSVHVNTVSNATLLTKELCRNILLSGLDEISFSIDGATKETYEQIRTGANFEHVTENIKTLTTLAANSTSPNLKICAFVVAMKKNMHELPGIVDLVHKLGIRNLWVQDVQFQQLDAGLATRKESLRAIAGQDNTEKKRIEQYLRMAMDRVNKYGMEIITYGGKSVFNRLKIPGARTKCSWPWTSAYVTWDGFVSPCCIPSTYYCGNLLQESFKKIWSNGKYRHFRSRLKRGPLPHQCINCSFL